MLIVWQDLIGCIAEAAETIRQQPGIFERIGQSLLESSAAYRGPWPYISTPAINWYEI